MDFHCDRCATRYSTGPAVRQGLAYRYRCRVCGHMIFVGAGAEASRDARAGAADPARDAPPRPPVASLRLVAPPAPTPPPLPERLFTPPVAGATARASAAADADVRLEAGPVVAHAGGLAVAAAPAPVRRPAPRVEPPPRVRPSFRPADAPNRGRSDLTPTVPLPLPGRRGRLANLLANLGREETWRDLTRRQRLAAVAAVFTVITGATIAAGIGLAGSAGEPARPAARAPASFAPARAAPAPSPAAPPAALRAPPAAPALPPPAPPAPPAPRPQDALPAPPQRIQAPVAVPRPPGRGAAPVRRERGEAPPHRAGGARPPRAELPRRGPAPREPDRREAARARARLAAETRVASATTVEPSRPAPRREPLPPAPAPAPIPAPADPRAEARASTRPVTFRDEEPVVARAGYRTPAPLTPGCVERSIRLPASWSDRLPGSVILRFAVGRGGTADLIQMQPGPDRLSGERVEPEIAQALTNAVRGCKFSPGADDQGRPTRMWSVMRIQFGR